MIKILLAEDEPKLRFLLAGYLKNEGYLVTAVGNGEEALARFYSDNFALCILDVMMPKLDGLSVCKEISEISPIPCIMLTALNAEHDELAGFQAGAVEYITKPFSPKILVTRVKNVLKREGLLQEKEFVYEDLKINYRKRKVYIAGEPVQMTHKEYELLCYIIANRNIVLTREQILTNVWGFDYDGDERTIDTHIKCLRSKLKDYGNLISTVRKVGYVLNTKTSDTQD
jgi:Response regulators consisting of a CheY-like receiver domain and a winged-helix DNA-binding domain